MDLRQTSSYASFIKNIGWYVEQGEGKQYFIKKIPLLGYAIKLQRTKTFPAKEIEILTKKYRVFQIIFEPLTLTKKDRQLLAENGFKLSGSPYLPTKTLQIDLSTSLEKVKAQMKKDARYAIRKTETLLVNEVSDISEFRVAWKQAVGNKRHVLPMHELLAFKKAFGENMVIIMNKFKTSGALFLLADNVCYYWVGFTDGFARKSLIQYKVLWSGMQWAKKKHAKVFDFEGIYDERFPNKAWKGFTHFKESFGGVEVAYPGCFIKWRLPF